MSARTRPWIARVGASAFAGVIAACATTQLEEQWRDSDYRAAGAQRVLVIAVMGREERRRAFEDQFAARLAKAGVEAKASYPVLSVSGPEDLDEVRRAVGQIGATLVLSVRLLDVAQETVVSGGYYGPVGFYSYYPHARSGAYYYPPDVHSYTNFLTETRVFDMASDKMVWAATMKTTEPSDFTAAAAQYADLVVKQLQYNKIVAGR